MELKLIEINKYTRTFAKYETAVEKAQETINAVALDDVQPTDISVVIHSKYGRFTPVFFLRQRAQYLARYIAERGFSVTC